MNIIDLEKYFNILLIEKKNVVNVNADIAMDIDENKKNEFKSMLDKALSKVFSFKAYF